MNRQKTITHGDVTIVVRAPRVRENLTLSAIRLSWDFNNIEDLTIRLAVHALSMFMVQTVSIEGDIPFALPDTSASYEDVQPVVESMLDELDPALYELWSNTCYELQLPSAGNLAPPEFIPEASKKK